MDKIKYIIKKYFPPFLKRFLRLSAYRFENRHRSRIARKFLHGSGIEIGALFRPLPLPKKTQVKYVDRHNRGELIAEYPEISYMPFVEVDIIDNGEELKT